MKSLYFVLFCLLKGSIAMAAGPVVSYVGLPGSGIELLPASSPEFMAALNAAADPHAVPLLLPIMPYSVIVKNGTSERLILIPIRFFLKNQSGRATWRDIALTTPAVSSMNAFVPGAMVLMTPEGGLNTALRPGSNLRIPKGDELSKRLATLALLFSQESEIEVRLDSVVFADGGVIGPDAHRTLEMLNAETRADDAITAEVLARNGTDVAGYLQTVAEAPVPNVVSRSQEEWFERERRRFARVLLGLLNSRQSEGQFYDYVRGFAKSRTPVLKRR